MFFFLKISTINLRGRSFRNHTTCETNFQLKYEIRRENNSQGENSTKYLILTDRVGNFKKAGSPEYREIYRNLLRPKIFPHRDGVSVRRRIIQKNNLKRFIY